LNIFNGQIYNLYSIRAREIEIHIKIEDRES